MKVFPRPIRSLDIGGVAWSSRNGYAVRTREVDTQIRRGFRKLWFSPRLEREFASHLRASGQLSRIPAFIVAIVSILIIPLLDTSWMGMPEALAAPSRWLQFGLMLPVSLFATLFCLLNHRSRILEGVIMLMFFALVAGMLAQRTIDMSDDYPFPLELIGIVVVAAFALARVRFWVVLPCALVACVATIACELSIAAPAPMLRYHLFATAVLVALGVCIGYSSEYFIRWSWLNHRLLVYLCHLDGLTGLLNRPALETAVLRAECEARRESRGYAVAMVDIDGFGAYNAHYGHQAGDRALRRVATILAARARRPRDVCGRYGGEEFLLLWGDGDMSALFAQAEAARAAVEAAHISSARSPAGKWLTVSIGVCYVDNQRGDARFEQVLEHADQLLYQAKAAGRNRVCSARYPAFASANQPAEHDHAQERPDYGDEQTSTQQRA